MLDFSCKLFMDNDLGFFAAKMRKTPNAASRNRRNCTTDRTDNKDFSTQSRQVAKTQRRKELFVPLQCYLRKLCILRKVFHALFSLFAPVHVVWLRLAALRLCAFAFISRVSIGPFPSVAADRAVFFAVILFLDLQGTA
jgi:hypothetical protein